MYCWIQSSRWQRPALSSRWSQTSIFNLPAPFKHSANCFPHSVRSIFSVFFLSVLCSIHISWFVYLYFQFDSTGYHSDYFRFFFFILLISFSFLFFFPLFFYLLLTEQHFLIFNGSSGRGHPIRDVLSPQVSNVVYAIQCQHCV